MVDTIATFGKDYTEASEEEEESEGNDGYVIAVMVTTLILIMVLGICCFLVIRKITRKRSRHRILNRDGDEEVDEATGARI